MTKAEMKNLKDSASKVYAQFGELGADAAKADMAHPEACMLFGKLVNEGTINIPEGDSAMLKEQALICLRNFHEAKAARTNVKCPADESLKTYVAAYVLFANKRVHDSIESLESAVKAYTGKKTKKQMGGKGYFDILKSAASRVSKAKEGETVPLTKATFDSIVAGKAAQADGGTVKSPADIAKGALKSGLAAALKDGGFSKAKQKAIRDFAETLGIEL